MTPHFILNPYVQFNPSNKEVTEDLKLTDEQKISLKNIFKDFEDKVKKSEDRDYKVYTLCRLGAIINNQEWYE